MDAESARRDLEFAKRVLERTSQRIDAHAYHCVHWGLIVLVWFPLGNWLWHADRMDWYIGVGIGSVLLGAALSVRGGIAAQRRPRLPAGNTFVSNQLAWIAGANIAAGGVLSIVAPACRLIDGSNVPIIWGLVYANMAFMNGVTYSRDFLIAGCVIFAGSIAAIAFQRVNGYILGPIMALGMVVPGVRAELRVRRLLAAEEGVDRPAASV